MGIFKKKIEKEGGEFESGGFVYYPPAWIEIMKNLYLVAIAERNLWVYKIPINIDT